MAEKLGTCVVQMRGGYSSTFKNVTKQNCANRADHNVGITSKWTPNADDD